MSQEHLQMGLSQAEVEQFWADGFLVVDGLFSNEEVGVLKQACTAPQDQQWEQVDHTVHSLELTVRHPAFLDLARPANRQPAHFAYRSRHSTSALKIGCTAETKEKGRVPLAPGLCLFPPLQYRSGGCDGYAG